MLETIREYARERLGEAPAPFTRSARGVLPRTGAEAAAAATTSRLSRDEFDWFVRELRQPARGARLVARAGPSSGSYGSSIASSDTGTAAGTGSKVARGSSLPSRPPPECAPGRGPRRWTARWTCVHAKVNTRAGRSSWRRRLLLYASSSGRSGPPHSHALIMLAICEEKLGNSSRALELYDMGQAWRLTSVHASRSILGNLGNMAIEEHDYGRSSHLHRRGRCDQPAPRTAWSSLRTT